MPAPRPTEVGASRGSPAQLAPFDAAQAEGVLFGGRGSRDALQPGSVMHLGFVPDVARASKFALPLSSTAHQMFMQASSVQASSAGHGREGDSAVIKIFPGIALPGRSASDQGKTK